MRDAARSGSKRWALGNWDLRWKVTAVLAVPLAVAVGLGVSRITSEFSEANRLALIAENVSTIPVVAALSAQTATTAGSQMIALAPGASVVTDQNMADLDKAIGNAEKVLDNLNGVPGARASFASMITQATAARAQGKAVTTQSAAEVIGTIDRGRNDSVRIVESTVGQVSDRAVEAAKLRLVDSLNTRASLVGELAAFPEVLRSPQTGVQTFVAAANTERSLLNVLAHRLPDGDTSIADMRAGIDNRIALLSSPQAQAGQIPVGELRESLTDSFAVYERVVGKATKDIDTAMDSLVSKAQTDAWTYTAVVIATILAALLLAVFVARSMIVPLHRLRLAALRVAESDLPHEVAQLRNGAAPEEVPLEPMPVRSTEEIGQLARAVDDIHGQALRLASDQAQMRSQVNDMFETLARRSKSLVDHQLSLIEAMEYDEKDPRLLENLFRLDHLAARMRRNGDNLLILAGTKQRRARSAPVEIADVLRAAISEVEDYERVKLGATPRGSLVEPAASDLAHLFAELLDNALRASPPETDVKFTFAQAHDQGLLIEVADRGIGMPPAEMADVNRRLEQTAEPGPDTARHMGLFVVGRLAERHGLTVRLRPTFDTARDPGVTVAVHVPIGLIVHGQGQESVAMTQVPTEAPRRHSPLTAMQTRAITRTSGGNVMVTVDPGVSGPLLASPPAAPSSDPIPAGGDGLPQRRPGSSMAQGLRQDAQQSGTTLRQASGPASNGPQRGKLAAANLPRRNLNPGGPPRPPSGPVEPTVTGPSSGELPQRKPGTNGVPPLSSTGRPQRKSGLNGVPQRDTGASRPPQRDPGATGVPQRRSGAAGLPQRDSASNGLPQREPGASGVPQRESGSSGVPQRDSGLTGLPQRESGATGLPQRDPGANGVPQRRSAAGLPRRDSAPNGLPQRRPGSLVPPDLPQRDPGVSGLSQRNSTPGVALPQRRGAQQPAASGEQPAVSESGALPASRDPGRHRYRSSPAKTASFFQTRLQPAAETPSSMDSPIFAEMMSAWLADPNPDRSQVAASFESPGDEGWQAARRASEAQAETRTAAGLPQRNPGGRLVPGGVVGAADRAPRRDPETIRSSLSRHQQGVRDGRAMRAMNLTGDKGDR